MNDEKIINFIYNLSKDYYNEKKNLVIDYDDDYEDYRSRYEEPVPVPVWHPYPDPPVVKVADDSLPQPRRKYME